MNVINKAIVTARRVLADRDRRAFIDVFKPEGDLTKSAEIVMIYLRRECSATTTTFNKNPLRMAYENGKRDVYLEIMAQINLTEEQLYRLIEEPPTEETGDWDVT